MAFYCKCGHTRGKHDNPQKDSGGVATMEKAGLNKQAVDFMFSWFEVKPFVVLFIVIYMAFFSKPNVDWIKSITKFCKRKKQTDAQN